MDQQHLLNRELLQVIHYDPISINRLHRDLKNPTPLAPWRTWVCGRYRGCETPQEFLETVDQAPGLVMALVHCDNEARRRLQEAGVDLEVWLNDDPNPASLTRRIVFYSEAWTFGHCTPERAIPGIRPWLSQADSQWGECIAAMPWGDHLTSPARPLAWWGSQWGGMRLNVVAQPLGTWDQHCKCYDEYTIGFKLNHPERSFRRRVADRMERLLTHYLCTKRPKMYDRSGRWRELLGLGDDLWLLEGWAESRIEEEGWDKQTRQGLADGRKILEEFPGIGDGNGPFDPEDWREWEPTRRAYEDLIARYR